MFESHAMFHIEVTTKCNQTCVFCGRNAILDKIKKGEKVPGTMELNKNMDMDTFKKSLGYIVAHAKKYNIEKYVTLHGDGEPLLWPHYKEAVRLAKKNGVRLQLITNGSLLNEEVIDFILENIDYKLKVSISGATNETLMAVTKNKLSRNTIGNCKLLIRKIRERNLKPEELVFGFVIVEENRHEVEMFKDIWKNDLDLVRLHIVEALPFSDALNRKVSTDIKGHCSLLGYNRLRIGLDGTIHPCCRSQELPLGKINDTSLNDLEQNVTYQNMLRLNAKNQLGKIDVCNKMCLAGAGNYWVPKTNIFVKYALGLTKLLKRMTIRHG